MCDLKQNAKIDIASLDAGGIQLIESNDRNCSDTNKECNESTVIASSSTLGPLH